MAAKILALTSSETAALRATLRILLKGGKPELPPEQIGSLENIYTELTRKATPNAIKP